MMLDNGFEANTFTCMMILESCNVKGRGLCDVAMVLYSKLAISLKKEPVPQVIKDQLVKVCLSGFLHTVSIYPAESFKRVLCRQCLARCTGQLA